MTMTMRAGLGVLVVGLLLACGSDRKGTAGNEEARGGEGKAGRTVTKNDVGDAPLVNGKSSLARLGKAVVDALNAKDGKALLGLAVSEEEYKARLFGALVSDPTVARVGPELAWTNQAKGSFAGMAKALEEHAGKGYVFVSLESTSKEERGGLVMHRDPKLTVKDAGGATLTPKFLGVVVEHPASGTFLVLSFAG
jgi:hypothetical protein